MYLLWLVLLLVLLGFTLRPVPYLEGMKSKGTVKSQASGYKGTGFATKSSHGSSYLANTSKGTYAGYNGPHGRARMTPNHSSYVANTPQGTYAGYNGQNVQATVNPYSSSYVANTPQGTYAGYNGQNVQAS